MMMIDRFLDADQHLKPAFPRNLPFFLLWIELYIDLLLAACDLCFYIIFDRLI